MRDPLTAWQAPLLGVTEQRCPACRRRLVVDATGLYCPGCLTCPTCQGRGCTACTALLAEQEARYAWE